MNVIVTGASRGIGAACVRAFSFRGDNVAFIYKNSDAAAEALRCECGAFPVKADLAVREDAVRAIGQAAHILGGVDVLVNNAGVSSFGLFSDLTPEEYERVRRVNLDAALWCTQALLPSMINKKSGSIVNISSVWGERGASCEVIYSVTKAALIGFTKALAAELGPSGIRVNCVTPGVIETDMNSALTADVMSELADQTPLCRNGFPEEVASAVLFLSSPAAAFITGATIPVNGGF